MEYYTYLNKVVKFIQDEENKIKEFSLGDILETCVKIAKQSDFTHHLGTSNFDSLYKSINRLYKALGYVYQCRGLNTRKYSFYYSILASKYILAKNMLSVVPEKIKDVEAYVDIFNHYASIGVNCNPIFNYARLDDGTYNIEYVDYFQVIDVKNGEVENIDEDFIFGILRLLIDLKRGLILYYREDNNITMDIIRAIFVLFMVTYPVIAKYLGCKMYELETALGEDPNTALPAEYKEIMEMISCKKPVAGIMPYVPEHVLKSEQILQVLPSYIRLKFKEGYRNNLPFDLCQDGMYIQLFKEPFGINYQDDICYQPTLGVNLYPKHIDFYIDLILNSRSYYGIWLREVLSCWAISADNILEKNSHIEHNQMMFNLMFYHGHELKECLLDVLNSEHYYLNDSNGDKYTEDDIVFIS